MSSDRMIVDPNGQQFRADSFERFGDDLCGLLLSYLTFKEKLGLRCVSKQWDRTILSTQYSLTNNAFNLGNDPSHLFIDRCYWSMDLLGGLLSKCPIKRLDFVYLTLTNSLIDIICECCPFLESIAGCLSFLSSQAITRFGRRFGQQMRVIVFRGVLIIAGTTKLLISLCPNLRELTFDDYRHVDYRNIKPLKKLKKLFIKVHSFDKYIFADINRFAPNLKFLEMVQSDFVTTTQELDQPFLESVPISMTKLEVFKVVRFKMDDKFFAILLQLMPNIKSLSVTTISELEYDSLASLLYLTKLTRLTILLSHPFRTQFDDCFFDDLIQRYPNLKRFESNFYLHMSEQMLDRVIEVANKRINKLFKIKCNAFQHNLIQLFQRKVGPDNLDVTLIGQDNNFISITNVHRYN